MDELTGQASDNGDAGGGGGFYGTAESGVSQGDILDTSLNLI